MLPIKLNFIKSVMPKLLINNKFCSDISSMILD